MTFKQYLNRSANVTGKFPSVRKHGGKFSDGIENVKDWSMSGMLDQISKTRFKASSFSHFDSEKQICKLCYETCYSVKSQYGNGWQMMNTIDNKPHRVWVNRHLYCKMAKKSGVEYE